MIVSAKKKKTCMEKTKGNFKVAFLVAFYASGKILEGRLQDVCTFGYV